MKDFRLHDHMGLEKETRTRALQMVMHVPCSDWSGSHPHQVRSLNLEGVHGTCQLLQFVADDAPPAGPAACWVLARAYAMDSRPSGGTCGPVCSCMCAWCPRAVR